MECASGALRDDCVRHPLLPFLRHSRGVVFMHSRNLRLNDESVAKPFANAMREIESVELRKSSAAMESLI